MNIDNLTKEQVLALSKEERVAVLSAKQENLVYSDSVICTVSQVKEVQSKAGDTLKASGLPELPKDALAVKIVCNASMFCDSKGNVFSEEAYDESVRLKGAAIPHIADHDQTSTAHVGDVTKVYTEKLDLKTLGLDVKGKITVLVMESIVRKDYNPEVFKFYENGKINQHSIGLNYVNVQFALDSKREEDEVEKALWDEIYPQILNKDVVDARGYFLYSTEINVNENSCVLFGANSLTPTLVVKSDLLSTTINQPTKVGTTMDLQEALAANAILTAEVATLKAGSAGELAKGASTEKARITAILTSAKTLGMKPEFALKQIEGDVDKDVALTVFEAVKEGLEDANTLNTGGQGDKSTINDTTTQDSVDDDTLSMSDFEKAIDSVDKDPKAPDWGNL